MLIPPSILTENDVWRLERGPVLTFFFANATFILNERLIKRSFNIKTSLNSVS